MGILISDTLFEEANIAMLNESIDNDGTPRLYIHGTFMQAEKKNRNGRIYPKSILKNACDIYINDYVKRNRALGEIEHPPRLKVESKEASHRVTELVWEGNDVLGKAIVLEETPCGSVLKGLLKGGTQMGVSSRASGTVKKNREGIDIVQQDLRLCAIDAVLDPSAPDAFVNGLMEGVNWIYENGVFLQADGRIIEESVDLIRSTPSYDLDAVKLKVFGDFLSAIK